MNVHGQGFGVYQSVATITADPARLVVLLFDGAITYLRQAGESLDRGDVATFAARISRAQAIIAELTDSLDRDAAGDIGANLGRLYDYMASHLTRGLLARDGGPVPGGHHAAPRAPRGLRGRAQHPGAARWHRLAR